MLIRLIPDQVEAKWEYYAPAIAKALPPAAAGSRRAMVNILEAVLMEELVVWLITDKDQKEVYGVLTTTLEYDEVSKTRNLLIYSFSSFAQISANMWNNISETLGKYAVSKNCQHILAYTRNDKIVKFFEERGANTENTLIQMEV